jgi:hypothetical protein
MSEETRKVLEMLRQGTIGVEEAEKLLGAVGSTDTPAADTTGVGLRRYLRIQVDPEGETGGDRVNIRVPMKLIRAGLKLAAFLPQGAQTQVSAALKEKGMDFDLSRLTPQDLEELVANLDDLTVDVEGKQKVRIFSE